MATSATIRRREPVPAARIITWPRTATILDTDGALLTEARAVGPPQHGRILLGDVAGPAVLLEYCFGRGCRRVMLSLGDMPVEGWLETRWEGSRRSWWLELDG